MKRNSIIAFSVCAVLLSSGGAGFYRQKTSAKDFAISTTSRALSDMDEEELISDLREKLNTGKTMDLGLYAALLVKRKNDRTVDLLKKEIINGDNSDVAQTAFYDILNHLILENDTQNVDELRGYIDKKIVCDNVKARIINEWTTSKEDVEFLSGKVSDSNKRIAYYSLKRLYELDTVKGFKKARTLLNQSANSTNKKVDAARYIVSDVIRNTLNGKEKEKWIEKCIEWFENAEKAEVRQRWVYALSYMNDKRALEAIINNSKVTDEEKQCAVYENQELAKESDSMKIQSLNNFAIGKKGYVAFRNGELVLEWHSAIVTSKKPRGNMKKNGNIVQAIGPKKCASKDSWNNFLDGYEFKGFFKAKEGSTKKKRILIMEMARKIASYEIPYCFLEMIQIKEGVTSSVILPENISALRCDGLVEYCYEYYGLRLQGDDQYWNITQNTKGARRAHSLLYSWVSPKKQAECMKPC